MLKMKIFSFPTPVLVGMERLLMKLGNAQNQSYPVIPIAVREVFSMTDATDRSEDYTVNVLFFSQSMITLGCFIVISVP